MKKKAASSANSRTSFKEVSSGQTDLNGSFIQSAIPVEMHPRLASTSSQSLQDIASRTHFSLLQKLDESRESVIKQMNDLEAQK